MNANTRWFEPSPGPASSKIDERRQIDRVDRDASPRSGATVPERAVDPGQHQPVACSISSVPPSAGNRKSRASAHVSARRHQRGHAAAHAHGRTPPESPVGTSTRTTPPRSNRASKGCSPNAEAADEDDLRRSRRTAGLAPFRPTSQALRAVVESSNSLGSSNAATVAIGESRSPRIRIAPGARAAWIRAPPGSNDSGRAVPASSVVSNGPGPRATAGKVRRALNARVVSKLDPNPAA